jgi:hypothetical protein
MTVTLCAWPQGGAGQDRRKWIALPPDQLAATAPLSAPVMPDSEFCGAHPNRHFSGCISSLVPEPGEQAAIERMRTMRHEGSTLFAIRDALRATGFAISHETVRQVLARNG